jgi:hypothetical protein
MESNLTLKTKYTGAEIMLLLTKKPECRKLTEKQSKISANLAYPAMLRNKTIKMKSNKLTQ